MKQIYFILFLIAVSFKVNAIQHTITNSGTAFNPAVLTVKVGDTINFNIESFHNAVEVNKDVWDANGTTSNGGFSLPKGGGQVIVSKTGTLYYVCQPHASMGMKGQIIVQSANSISEFQMDNSENLKIYPNPVRGNLNLYINLKKPTNAQVYIINMAGEEVQRISLGNLKQGVYYKSLVVSSQNKQGRYFAVLHADGQRYVKPFILLR